MSRLLEKWYDEVKIWFYYLLEMKLSEWGGWIFDSSVDTIDIEFQEHLMDLESDSTLLLEYKNDSWNFWICTGIKKSLKEGMFYNISFPSSYLQESGFSKL